MDRQSQSCPACQEHFIPWNVGRISTWSCIQCPHCDTALNRRIDRQFIVVYATAMVLIPQILRMPISIWQQGLLSLLSAAAAYGVDALTVRLVIAGEWRGIRGYTT